ncbi:MAG: ATP-binding protein, partial [Pseudomonadota bacterium]
MSMQSQERWQFVATLALLVCTAAATQARGQPTPEASAGAMLHVGVPMLGAPLAFRGEDGRPAGVLVEYWQAKRTRRGGGVAVTLCATAEDCLADLEAGALDLAGPMAIVDRNDDITFSAPVLSIPIGAATLAAEAPHPDARALQGSRVSVVDASGRATALPAPCTRLELCNALDRWAPANVQVAAPDASVAHAEAGLVVAPQAVLAQLFASESKTKVFTLWRSWLYLAARGADSTRLLAVEEDFLAAAPERLAQLPALAAALGGEEALTLPGGVPFLSRDEKLFIARHPAVYLGASVWEPLTVLHEGRVSGIAVESVRFHLDRLGVTPVFEVDEWSNVRNRAERGELDGLGYVVAAGVSPDSKLLLSNALADMPFVAAIGPAAPFMSRVEELVDLRVVVQNAYRGLVPAVQASFEGVDIQFVRDPYEALAALETGSAQAWLDFLPVVSHAVMRTYQDDTASTIRTMRTPLFERVCLAAQEEMDTLVELVDRSIASASVDVAAIEARWLGAMPVGLTADRTRDRGLQLALILLSVSLAAGCVHLIRARMRESAKLALSEAALRRAQLLSGVGSMEVPAPYDRVVLNGETALLLGLGRDVSEQPLQEHLALFEDEGAAQLRAALERTWRTGEGEGLTVTGVGTAPSRFQVELAPPQRTEQHRDSVLVTLRDVTEERLREQRQRALEHEVVELQKLDAVGRLAASIAHDFNNVLSVILGSAELALRDLPEEHAAAKPVRQVREAGLRSRELVGQMLNSVRPPARERQRFSLRSVVEETLGLLSHGIPSNVILMRHLADDELLLAGNEVQLRQVVGNLVRNAVEAMPEGGELTVSLGRIRTELGVRALLRVADTGIGMSEDTLANCFEFFYTTRAQGTGLGLAIVRSLVTAHRGRVEVTSQLGEGT